MRHKIRVGAVSYLNTRPLVHGFEQGLGRDLIELSYDVPSTLSDRLARDELDVALIPVIELARIPDLEIVPGLGIVSRGPARSVFLISNGPPEKARTVGLDVDLASIRDALAPRGILIQSNRRREGKLLVGTFLLGAILVSLSGVFAPGPMTAVTVGSAGGTASIVIDAITVGAEVLPARSV